MTYDPQAAMDSYHAGAEGDRPFYGDGEVFVSAAVTERPQPEPNTLEIQTAEQPISRRPILKAERIY